MYIPVLVSALGGYLIGNFNLAYIVAKAKGFDIRSKGSNNPGASNAAITMGWKFGVLVALADILKAALAVMIFRTVFDSEFAGMWAGVAAVMGHMYPFWMKFKGGKGFASFAGMALGMDWRYFAIIGAAVILVILISDYIVLGTLTAVISFPISWGIINHTFWALLIAGVSTIIILKHIPNYIKMAKGTEFKVSKVLFKKKG
ncbi:MAG: glycerol-3-phosphate acyltransferase [Clostridia bacterium]|nr:glycerol-3-phosphate acyltransferase [Clostridia bacterium]